MGDDEVPFIFLTHSGKQKTFVENLYDALLRANHTAFFDKHTLPKGSPFPPHIIRAAHGCRLGVVVLSEEFLTSKWPMVELEILVKQRGPNAAVLPVFYRIGPDELKSPTNLIKWRHVWKEASQDANKWEQAIKALGSFNGEVFIQGTSEATFIKNVVRRICQLVPSRIPYDVSPIQGHQRLTQEIASQFEEAARQCDKVYCTVGLHGVGGLGKTTICHMMCNFYMSEYLGKSCHIEFPSDKDDKKIVQECKKALKELANLSDEHVLNRVDSFDQVVQLMKENLGRHDLFLAIDNVWESSLQAAKRLLEVSFTPNSKILLTSRSEEVLKELVGNTCSVRPLPSPDWDEAFQILQETFEVGDLKSLVNRDLLDRVLNTCFFSDKYHALALKALGQHVKRVCKLEGLIKIEDILSNILVRQNDDVESLIRLNYVNLAAYKQHMFLDIVVVVKHDPWTYKLTSERAHEWLSIVYKKFPKATISRLIYELALDGLIQLEDIDDKNGGKLIRVHDLYIDLAQKEAAKSARFLTDTATSKKVVWERLERVILDASHIKSCFIEELHQQQCPKLAVLCVEKIHLSGIHLDLMPSLCVLKLKWGNLGSVNNLSAATGLAIVHLKCLSDLRNLDGLSGLTCLERLVLDGNDYMEVVGGLSPALKHVEVYGCVALKRLPDVSGLTCLESLVLYGNQSMEMVGGENLSSTLKHLEVYDCRRLRYFPSFNGCVHLQTLRASAGAFINNERGSLEKLRNLEELELCEGEWAYLIRGITSTHLQRLRLEGCESLLRLEVGSYNLKELAVRDCKALEEIVDLNALHSLEKLVVTDCPSLKNLGGLCLSHLQTLALSDCGSLEESIMPDVSLIPTVSIRKCGDIPAVNTRAFRRVPFPLE